MSAVAAFRLWSLLGVPCLARAPSGAFGKHPPFRRENRCEAYQGLRPCTHRRPGIRAWPPSTGSGPVAPRRPKATTYRCFLPDLTGFVELCRAGPGLQRRPPVPVPGFPGLEREFDPAVADCGFRAPLAPRLARPQAMLYRT